MIQPEGVFAEPDLRGNEAIYLKRCLEIGWISSIGPFVSDFEKRLADYVGLPHALTTGNGTVALHLALAALRIGPGDEVIVPDLTFAATANVVIYCGATPVLVDVSPDDWNLDPAAVAAAITPRTKAILPVHLYGHPCRLDEILEIARGHRFRQQGSRAFNLFVMKALGLETTDHLAGFWIMERERVLELKRRWDVFYGYGDYYIRMLYACRLAGIAVRELPVRYLSRLSGESNTSFRKELVRYTKTVMELRGERPELERRLAGWR